MLISTKMILWWHFSSIEKSAPKLKSIFRLLQNLGLMQENELFTVWVGLLINFLYFDYDVRVSFALLISLLHYFEYLALKSPLRTQKVGSLLLIWSIIVSKFVQKCSYLCWFWLGDRYRQVWEHFPFIKPISVTKQLLREHT